jgi:hypothetical protein
VEREGASCVLRLANWDPVSTFAPLYIMQPWIPSPSVSMHSYMIAIFSTQSPQQRQKHRTMNNGRPFALDGNSSSPRSGKCLAKTFSIGNNAFSGFSTEPDFSTFQSPIIVPERTTSGKPFATLPAKRKTRNPWTTQVRGNASNNTIPPIMCSDAQLLTLAFFCLT